MRIYKEFPNAGEVYLNVRVYPGQLTPIDRPDNDECTRSFVLHRPDIKRWLTSKGCWVDDSAPLILTLNCGNRNGEDYSVLSYRTTRYDNFPMYDNLNVPDPDKMTGEEYEDALEFYYEYALTEDGNKHLTGYINPDEEKNPEASIEYTFPMLPTIELSKLLRFAFPDVRFSNEEIVCCMWDNWNRYLPEYNR